MKSARTEQPKTVVDGGLVWRLTAPLSIQFSGYLWAAIHRLIPGDGWVRCTPLSRVSFLSYRGLPVFAVSCRQGEAAGRYRPPVSELQSGFNSPGLRLYKRLFNNSGLENAYERTTPGDDLRRAQGGHRTSHSRRASEGGQSCQPGAVFFGYFTVFRSVRGASLPDWQKQLPARKWRASSPRIPLFLDHDVTLQPLKRQLSKRDINRGWAETAGGVRWMTYRWW